MSAFRTTRALFLAAALTMPAAAQQQNPAAPQAQQAPDPEAAEARRVWKLAQESKNPVVALENALQAHQIYTKWYDTHVKKGGWPTQQEEGRFFGAPDTKEFHDFIEEYALAAARLYKDQAQNDVRRGTVTQQTLDKWHGIEDFLALAGFHGPGLGYGLDEIGLTLEEYNNIGAQIERQMKTPSARPANPRRVAENSHAKPELAA